MAAAAAAAAAATTTTTLGNTGVLRMGSLGWAGDGEVAVLR
jgi:hypothetical protein